MRIIFRVVDSSLGETTANPLATSEMYVFFLDALPMLAVLVLFNLCHPGLVLSPEMRTRRKRRAYNRDTTTTTQAVDSEGRHAHLHFVGEVPPPPPCYEPLQLSTPRVDEFDSVEQQMARKLSSGSDSDVDSDTDAKGSLRGNTVAGSPCAPAEESADLGEASPTRTTWKTR